MSWNADKIDVEIAIQGLQIPIMSGFAMLSSNTFSDVITESKRRIPLLKQSLANNQSNFSIRCQHCRDFIRNNSVTIGDHSKDNTLLILVDVIQPTAKIINQLSEQKQGINGDTPVNIRAQLHLDNINVVYFKQFATASSSYEDINMQLLNQLLKDKVIKKQFVERNVVVQSQGRIISKHKSFLALGIINKISKDVCLKISFNTYGG